jgi:hypothetical protein
MQKDIMDKEKRGGDLVTVNIPKETIDEVIKIGDDVAMWSKVVDGGFSINDKIITEYDGIILGINLYCVRWENKQPHKIPNILKEEDIPEGYERRADLKILVDGQIIGISLPKSSLKYQLSPYLRYLRNCGLKPNDVVTRLKSKQVSNSYGTFNVVVFEMLGSAKNVAAKKVEPQSGPDQGTPQVVPQSAAEQKTPSAIPSEWA